ncbi:kelch repeat and BTB domain-containing protein 2-like [Branchiostoma floridae x Branchiostoma japonicum]
MATAHPEPHVSAVRPRFYQDESYLHGFLGTVGDLQKARAFQDVVLEVEDRRFPCHRLVLSAASPYFRAMFTSDMAESQQEMVVLQGLDAGIFGEILSYIYSGTLYVSLDKVQSLYQAADLLQLDYVRGTCSSYMAMNVGRSTCVDLYKFADVFSLDNVQKCSLQWIARHFTEVASSKEFSSLSITQLTEIISHDELDVKEERTVWKAVVRWVQHSREDRLHHLPSILSHIRYNLLTSDDTAVMMEHPMVREDPGISEVIRNLAQKGNYNLKPRLGMTTEMAIWLNPTRGKVYTCSNELFFMNPHEEKYTSCTYKPEDFPRVTDMVVTSDNEIYILQTEELEDENQMFLETQMSLFKYSHAENAWEHAGVSSISKGPGDDFSSDDERLCEVDRIFYYIAIDSKEHRPLLKMRKYNQDMNQWEECSQLKLKGCGYHRDFAALSCSPYLYFLTRWEFHRYDPSQDRWSKLVPPMISDEVCTGVVMGTEIFCTDFHNTQTMVYDTESDCWQKLQGWPNPGNLGITYRPSLFVVENQLHILLKVYDTASQEAPTWSSIDCRVYVYDRSADAWSDLKATLPDKKYHVYGCAPVARVYLPYLKGT